MFLINCPYCGERDQSEFSAGGEAHIVRPKQPTELSDDQWDTSNDKIHAVYKMDEKPPIK